jgi:ribonuclease HI
MKITIFTDGSSRGNPGPGGWGAIVLSESTVTELGGREDMTTNNRMELRSAIEALKNVKEDDDVIVNADSEYVIKGITLWIQGWINKGWKTASKKPVLNQDLWKELSEVTKNKNIKWQVVAGHAGIVGNERADVIATSFADNNSEKLYKGPIDAYTHKIV